MVAYWVRFIHRFKVKDFGVLSADGQVAQRSGAHAPAAADIDRAMLIATVVLLTVAALQFSLLVH